MAVASGAGRRDGAGISIPRLRGATERIFAADRELKDARPDDRIVVEDLILALTA